MNLVRSKTRGLSYLIHGRKIQFERQILERCKRKDVCACCSIAYCASHLVLTNVGDIDFCPLLKKENYTVRSSLIVNKGPLSEFLLDDRGIVHMESFDGERVQLFDICLRALRRSTVPQFALANHSSWVMFLPN